MEAMRLSRAARPTRRDSLTGSGSLEASGLNGGCTMRRRRKATAATGATCRLMMLLAQTGSGFPVWTTGQRLLQWAFRCHLLLPCPSHLLRSAGLDGFFFTMPAALRETQPAVAAERPGLVGAGNRPFRAPGCDHYHLNSFDKPWTCAVCGATHPAVSRRGNGPARSWQVPRMTNQAIPDTAASLGYLVRSIRRHLPGCCHVAGASLHLFLAARTRGV